MYANPPNVHQGHNQQHYLPHIHSNGHANHPAPQMHPQHSPAQPPPPQRPAPAASIPKSPINVVGIPSVHIENNQLVVGSSQSSSTRSYTPLKVLGDGSFGTVWLCDWHGTLPPNTPLSPMQCGAGARPEWAGKRLVAVKRMKKKWEGGWDECQKLKEIESLRAIPFHPNIIPLYDFFLLPASKELYFVFESMEGNLYHLIKARKGRALAGGLVSSIFRQISAGLVHIHANGYFHRDMKPENVLVTTTGLHDYVTLSPIAPPNAPPEKDVVAIIKLADFGLARETNSKPPYTEYVSTRWYRAPEVLLLSRDYSNPVDMWALGTIMAELVNLRPMFPGADQVDQVARICEVLGDPCDEYGVDQLGNPIGGGAWPNGIKMAKAVGFAFRKMQPKDIFSLFERTVPVSLIHCIRDLLRYDPSARLTSRQCLEHPYLLETTPRNNIPIPAGLRVSTTSLPNIPHHRNGASPSATLSSLSPRSIPPSHSNSNPSTHHYQFPNASNTHRSSFFPVPPVPPLPSHYQPHSQVPDLIQEESRHPQHTSWETDRSSSATNGGDYPMESPQSELDDYGVHGQPMDVQTSPMVPEYPIRPHLESEPTYVDGSDIVQSQSSKSTTKLGLSFGKKHSKWSLGMFGGDKSHQGLPPVHEIPAASSSTPSLKRTQSSSSDSRSLRDPSPSREPLRRVDLKKMNKKEAEKVQREAEKQRRALAEKMHRDQARAVMQKRNQIMQKTTGKDDLEWRGGSEQRLEFSEAMKGKQAATGPIRQNQPMQFTGNPAGLTTVNAAAGRFGASGDVTMNGAGDWRRDSERATKARRRDYDEYSMSSSDVHSAHSASRMSTISFASVDSDPGPSRIRNRPSLFGLNRMQSASSLRASFDDFAPSARSSNSFSLEGQLAHDFRTQATMNNPGTPLSGNVSPPPMQMLSLSPSLSPTHNPSPPWVHVQQHPEGLGSRRGQAPAYIGMPPHPVQPSPIPPYSPYEYNGQMHGHPPSPYGHPPSSGHTTKSDINPIFKVPPLPPNDDDERLSSPTSLPPFSELDAVAGAGYDYPPLSPMSFTPSEDA